MKVEEAFKHVCEYLGEKPVVMSCRKYPTAYGFFCAPQGTNPNEPAFTSPMICVDRRTGNVYTRYDPEYHLSGMHFISIKFQ